VLAARGVPLLLACRGEEQGQRAKSSILETTDSREQAVRLAALDVSNLDSVRQFCTTHAELRLRAIICNAGVQIITGVRRTEEGFEETFAANHLGHFLLSRLLSSQLVEEGGRIVFVASNTHDPLRCTGMPAPDASDLTGLADGTAFESESFAEAGRRRYTTSKLCNVLCAYELQRRLADPRRPAKKSVFAFDPGLMPGTGLARDYGPFARWAFRALLPALTIAPNVNSVRTSAKRLADLATGQLDAEPGSYVSCGRPLRSSDASYDEQLARQLWELSSRLCDVPPTFAGASA
jgi:NAD(P)-dependent dehydrogenase (short-subunit alcohol dehydrogenase family)